MTKTKSPSKDYGRFQIIEPDEDLAITGASEGVAGSGKSHFWLTAPDPIAYFLFEPGGLDGLKSNELFRDRFQSGAIRVIDYSQELNVGKIPRDERVEKALETLERFQQDWDTAIGFARTLVWDKEEYVWEMIRYAHDEVDSPEPKNFGELNLMYHGWFADVKKHKKNFGLVRGIEDTWGKTGINQKTGRPTMGFTGKMKPRGQKKVAELAHINLGHRWDDEEREFRVRILEKCRLGNAERLIGKEFGAFDFQQLAALLYPETTPEDWGYDE